MNTQNQAVATVAPATSPKSEIHIALLDKLSIEQRAALESKFMALPIEVRSDAATKYAGLTFAEMYVVRQMVKEANGKLASNNRGIWYSKLELNAASLKSGEEAIRKHAERELRTLAEELDSKESVTLLKKYKNSKDTTTKDAFIIQLAGIFGVSATNLA
jgi:hypothetical protein